ncbi:MAG: InlB B-repeat-containing protein, partial [Dethiosulfatibacter sp.]|nr:InlB B-repeat-containing protein [Dethiosulfatibacter sp.]
MKDRRILALVLVILLLLSSNISAFAGYNITTELIYTSNSAVLDASGFSTNEQTEIRLIWIKDNVLYLGLKSELKDVTGITYNGAPITTFNVDSARDKTVDLVVNGTAYPINYLGDPKKAGSYWSVASFNLSGLQLTSPFVISIDTDAGGFDVDDESVDILNGYIVNYYIQDTTTPVPGINPNPLLMLTSLIGMVDLPAHPSVTGYTLAPGQPTQINVTGENDSINIYYVAIEPTKYTVTFDKNSGDTEADPQTKEVVEGETVDALPTAPTKTDYTFEGWATTNDATEPNFDETT